MKKRIFSIISACLLAACNSGAETVRETPKAQGGWADAQARFIDRSGAPVGTAAFADSPAGGVLIRIEIEGLAPGWHGMHLHQVGDCSDGEAGFKASGGHVNPDGRPHGLMNPDGPERADLPNIYAGEDGKARVELFNPGVMLAAGGALPALMDADGFAVIVHEDPDDHVTQPIGGAGGRVACAAFGADG